MADCTTQPSVSEIVARADELYEANQMREGLSYLKQQYGHLDEVEVTLLALTIICLQSPFISWFVYERNLRLKQFQINFLDSHPTFLHASSVRLFSIK